jgi:hypothetical protein
MLIELFGRNFGPFRDEFRLSMLATDIDPGDKRGVVEVPIEGDDEPLRLLRCAAIYGPNASGKSWLLRAASALGYLIEYSATVSSDEPIGPYVPFALDEQSRARPAMLGVRAVIQRAVYEYWVEFEETRFTQERLARLAPGEETVLFERRGQDVTGPWTTQEQFALLAKSFRPNALLLSLADRLAPDLAGGVAVGMRRLLSHSDLSGFRFPPFVATSRAARRAHEDAAGFGAWLRPWLVAADVGIVDYRPKASSSYFEVEQSPEDDKPQRRRRPVFELSFVHAGAQGGAELRQSQESLGTLKVVELAPYIYDLTHGHENRAYFIDEIDVSVHPVLLESLIRHFNCETPAEEVRGQLILVTHETSILDGEARLAPLRRDQVYLTEKGNDGASRLYSVAEFKERNNLNLRKRYLEGRYGALPSPGPFGA